MQSLEVFQSLWAMERRQPDGIELSLPESFSKIAGAGFDGIALDTGLDDLQTLEAARPLLSEHNLQCLVTTFPETLDQVKRSLDVAGSVNARFVCVNAKIFPSTPSEGAEFVSNTLDLGREWNIDVFFETHRLTLTNDLLFTLELIDLVPELELVCDLSHYVVGRELPEPVDEFWNEKIEKILKRGVAFQGRVANREQVQVASHWPQHEYWLNQFNSWWDSGFRHWRQRQPADATLNFLCELGPAPYAITGADGFDLNDRWAEALSFKSRVHQLWLESAVD